MTRPRSEHDEQALNEQVGGGAAASSAPAPDDRRGVSATSAARTRTLGGETVEFRTVDYQPPQNASTAGGAPRAVAPAEGARLGRAAGVSSLRGGKPSPKAAGRDERLNVRTKAVIAAVLAVVALVVFVGGYFLAKNVLYSVNESASSATSAAYATDAYTLIAVEGADGALDAAYLGYVDSINGRVELCYLAPNTYYGDHDPDVGTLGEAFEKRGVEGLALAVAALADVQVPTSFAVSPAEFDEVLDLASDGSNADVSVLTATIWDDSQHITAAALRGLLLTMKQVEESGHLVLTAPADTQDVDGESVEVLRHEDWLVLVRGMRDPSSDVSASL